MTPNNDAGLSARLKDFRMEKLRSEWAFLISLSIISTFAFIFYYPILTSDTLGYVPWGSDTFGHIFRFEYLRESIEAGIYTPNVYPDWYLGIQLFRYYPSPLYYVLAGISSFFKNPIYTVNVFLFLTAWLGAISVLLYKRWIGWELATIGGVLFLILPDFVRVAFAEGNLLRHFTSALLPLMFYLVLYAIEMHNPRKYLLGLAVLLHLTVISHPMLAAIFSALIVFVFIMAWATQLIQFKKAALSISFVVLGVLSAGWWILPSLTGGITELSTEAMIAGLPVVSLWSLINPIAWFYNPEDFYLGMTLFIIPMLAMSFKNIREKKLVILIVPAVVGSVLVTPILNSIYNTVPLSSLMWPARFLTPTSFLLLVAALWAIHNIAKEKLGIAAVLLVLLSLEMTNSLKLIHLNPPYEALIEVSRDAAELTEWRQATLDNSRMGSGPSYYMTVVGGKEQVFGWAFQGASTSSLVSSINESMGVGSFAYLVDRFNLIGVDGVLLPTNLPYPNKLDEYIIEQGYELVGQENQLLYFHRDGEPRAVIADWKILGIGSGAQNYAYLFPQLIIGQSTRVDDYDLAALKSYDKVMLAGFSWNDKEAAETLIKEAASAGVTIIVDLTATQVNVIAQQPQFLEVWGEQIVLDTGRFTIYNEEETLYQLESFDYEGDYWQTHVPQGLEHEVLFFDYYGQEGVVAGYNEYGDGKVWFIGLNIAYHVVNTPDFEAINLLSDVLGTPPFTLNDYTTIPLENYVSSGDGLSFTYSLDASAQMVIPYAYFDNARVTVDGIVVVAESLSNLILIDAPAGTHSVEIVTVPAGVHILGMISSLISTAIIAIMGVRNTEKRR